MGEKTASAAVRIWTDEPSPEFIVKALGIAPSRQFLKGERMSSRNPDSAVFERSLCIYESVLSDSHELHQHIRNVLDLLGSKLGALGPVRNQITRIDLFCMFSSESGQGSAELDSNLLSRIAGLGMDLIVDLYPPLGSAEMAK